MDHLPLARDAVPLPIVVPYVVKAALLEMPYSYNDEDFISFPEQHLRVLRLIDPDVGSQDALLSLAQSWLFFGTVAEFFEQPIRSSLFTRQDHDGDAVICTAALNGLRSRWIASLPSRAIHRAALRQIVGRRCGVILARATWAFSQLKESPLADDSRGRLVLLSIQVLLCSLCQTVRTVLYPTQTLDAIFYRLRFRPMTDGNGRRTDFMLWDYMFRNGWCPVQINHLVSMHSATALIYLASVPRGSSNTSHEDCPLKGRCKACQTDPVTFKPNHVTPGCTCTDVAVDEDDIMFQLENKKIPLVSCRKNMAGEFTLDIIPADVNTVFGTPTLYYAISHVWADGLGNPAANSLPRCQFERLYAKLEALSTVVAKSHPLYTLRPRPMGHSTSVIFWMDVFCIPVERPGVQRNTDLKDVAIQLMDLTYSGAHQVLVLDAEMELIQRDDGIVNETERLNQSFESLSRVATCKWMTRSWTLQEGALASELWLDYANHPSKHKEFYTLKYRPSLVEDVPPELLSLADELEQQLSLPSVGRGAQHMSNAAPYCSSAREVQFLEVWNSLIGRSTTKPEDFHCIVANLLDYSAQELLKLGRHDVSEEDNDDDVKEQDRFGRMRAIIIAQKRLPMQIFCFTGRRACSSNGEMAWLPDRPVGPRLTDDCFACSVRVTSDGFAMESKTLTSCFLAWPSHSASSSFCLDIPSRNGAHPKISLDLPVPDDVRDLEVVLYLDVLTEAHSLVSDSRGRGAAFIVTERQNDKLQVKYTCPLTYCHCWDTHMGDESSDLVPAAALRNGTSVVVTGPKESSVLKFRRPPRVGANLIVTFPAKVILIPAGLTLITGIFMAIVMSFPSAQRFFFNWHIVDSLVVVYLWLAFVAVLYVGGLVFIFLRYVSTPWIRRSYLTDQLPWYVWLLYWERLPSILKLSMLYQRLFRIPFDFCLARSTPYDIKSHDVNRRLTKWMAMLKRVILRRPSQRRDARDTSSDYTDGDLGEIPLFHINGAPDTGTQITQRCEALLNGSESDIVELVGSDGVKLLRRIRLGLIATQSEDRGVGVWDIVLDSMVISRWLLRMQEGRRLKDFLFDYGFTTGGR